MRHLLPLALLVCTSAFGQSPLTIKKSNIIRDEKPVAAFDGKGGIFRTGRFGVFLPNSKDTLIALEEFIHQYKNPLYPEPLFLYKVDFKTGKHQPVYVRLKKVQARVLGRDASGYTTKYGKDLIQDVVIENAPFVITESGLNNDSVTQYLKNHTFNLDSAILSAKLAEDTIALLSKEVIVRDTKKPVTFVLAEKGLMNDAMSATFTYQIFQDNVLIGKVFKYQRTDQFPRVEYTFWKRANGGSTFWGNKGGFVPLAYIERGSFFAGATQALTLVVGKKQLEFRTPENFVNGELFLTNFLIANNLL